MSSVMAVGLPLKNDTRKLKQNKRQTHQSFVVFSPFHSVQKDMVDTAENFISY